MSNYKISIAGLDILKKQLAKDADIARIIPDMSISILKFHNMLERRVGEVFTLKQPLSSVMLGRSVKPSELGKTFLRYNLQYNYRRVDLADYRTIISESQAISSAPLRKGNFVRWTEGKWSQRVSVQLQPGKTLVARAGQNYRLKGFIVNKGGRQSIYAREGSRTWTKYPTYGFSGTRAPMRELYGPSLSRLASIAFDKDPQVAIAKITLQDDIIKAFTSFYD